MALDFHRFIDANRRRLALFKNKKGEPAHAEPDGSDWSLAEWSNAIAGEVGELVEAFEAYQNVAKLSTAAGRLCNYTKKILRKDYEVRELKENLAGECADVIIYTIITAMQADIDIEEALIKKFNAVSDRIGCDIKVYSVKPAS